MKILVAVPTFENIYPDTFKAIYGLDCGSHDVVFDFVRGYDCATARNRIVRRAQEEKADYVLMVDNDVVLPEDALLNLLDDPQDVVLGYYAHRDSDNLYRGKTCICKLLRPDGKKYHNYPLESEYTAEEVKAMRDAGDFRIRIHGGGMGCAMIKVDVFDRISYPYYDWVNYADGNRGMLSEDLYFCEQCKKQRIPIYTDTRVACGHLLRHIQWPD